MLISGRSRQLLLDYIIKEAVAVDDGEIMN
jgi:hypothetical protein